jgi:hypothetical protein
MNGPNFSPMDSSSDVRISTMATKSPSPLAASDPLSPDGGVSKVYVNARGQCGDRIHIP